MPSHSTTDFHSLLSSSQFRTSKEGLLKAIISASEKVRGVRAANSSPEVRASYQAAIKDFNRERGRDLYYPFLGSGLGSGPFVELLDGSVKLDMITGIGINFFGHAHPSFISEMIDGLSADVMQGNLQPGAEAKELLKLLLSRVGEGCRIKHGWLTCSGTMANEIALKMIRQKKAPATKILAFKNCFAGRSTAMQEITDNPKYRDGQPVYGEVEYLPFYDPSLGLEQSVIATLLTLKEHLNRYPGKFAGLMLEIVQGEGGFNFAPREYYVRVFEEAKKAGLAIWADEIQTFGRTGELYAYQTFGLEQYVDVVTVGKMLQACGVLFTEELNPKPGLVAGTFSGSTVALKTAKKAVEMLIEDGFLGKDGKITKLNSRFTKNLQSLSTGSCKGLITEIRSLGGMIAFKPLAGTMDEVKAVLMQLFDDGMVAFYCGHDPYLIRMLPPLGAMTDADVDLATSMIETAILHVSKERKGKTNG